MTSVEEAAQVQTAGEPGHGLVHRGNDHILQHFHIVGIHRLGIDLHRNQLMLAVDRGADHAAASLGGEGLGLLLGLHPQHLLLHLLGLLEHGSLIHSTGHTPESTLCHNSKSPILYSLIFTISACSRPNCISCSIRGLPLGFADKSTTTACI